MEARTFIACKIREFRTVKLRITAEKLGLLLVPKRSGKTISSWETGRTRPDTETMIQLCKIFDEPIAAFYPLASSKTANGTSGSCSEVALYGSIISGKPLAFIPIEGMKPCPLELRRKYPQGFFLRVKGQAMNNILPDGSFAFIDPLQSAPIDNRVYALCLNDDDAIIRRIKKLGNGFELLPDSNDPTLKPSIFDYADEGSNRIVVVGRVVWMMLPFDWEL